jgi:hypothetical protein
MLSDMCMVTRFCLPSTRPQNRPTRSRSPSPHHPQFLDANRGHLAKPPVAAATRGAGLCRAGRRGVDVFAVDVLRVADEGCALFAACVALLEAVELEACYDELSVNGWEGEGRGRSYELAAFRRNPL